MSAVDDPVDGLVDDAPIPVEPMDAERWPSARELTAERFDLPKDVPQQRAVDQMGNR